MRLVLAQLNLTVGDLEGNLESISRAIDEAVGIGADLIAFPELATTGYPPEDLLLKPSFVEANLGALEQVAARTGEIAAIVGFVGSTEGLLSNAAAFCRDGSVEAVYSKQQLPNYGVFDERRWFEPGGELVVVSVAGVNVGLSICEDAWSSEGPIPALAHAGAEVVVNINASPFHRGKGGERLRLLESRARQSDVAIAYVNLVGGQDELVFDGDSMFVDSDGELRGRASQFNQQLLVIETEGESPSDVADGLGPVGEVYEALLVGARDYVGKNGFNGAVVGLSGGVDSALTATIAVDAIGADQVVGVTMPSRFTSDATRSDAVELAERLGIRLEEIPIEGPFVAYLDALGPVFAGAPPDVTEENLQARIRGNYLMALSNKFGWLVLTTGNKSEMATGYSTLYGDLAGGFALIKDVPKSLVYELCKYRNGGSGDIGPIPQSIIDRPPTAELREGQLDQDSLPPYSVLDPILEMYVEDDKAVAEIADEGFDIEVVRRVVAMVDRAEYKRRQAPPGVKITKKAFGRDRRLPITNRFAGG